MAQVFSFYLAGVVGVGWLWREDPGIRVRFSCLLSKILSLHPFPFCAHSPHCI